jgi:hypothetical protein
MMVKHKWQKLENGSINHFEDFHNGPICNEYYSRSSHGKNLKAANEYRSDGCPKKKTKTMGKEKS